MPYGQPPEYVQRGQFVQQGENDDRQDAHQIARHVLNRVLTQIESRLKVREHEGHDGERRGVGHGGDHRPSTAH